MQSEPQGDRPEIQLPTLYLGNVCFLDIEDLKAMPPANLAELMRRLVATQNPPTARSNPTDSPARG